MAGRQSAFIVHPLLLWDDPADDERMIRLGRAYREDLRAFSSGATYLNFLATRPARRRDFEAEIERELAERHLTYALTCTLPTWRTVAATGRPDVSAWGKLGAAELGP